jgi:hypothetical protein
MKDIAMNFKRKVCAALAAALLVALPAQASLVNLGDGTVWDSATNLVWLKDWNLNGLADPDAQGAWANNLVFAGASNWVLPTWQQFIDVRRDGGSYENFKTIFDNVGAGQVATAGDPYYWSSTYRAPDQCPGDNLVAGASPAPDAFPGQNAVGIRMLGAACYYDLTDLHNTPNGAFQGGVAVRTGGVLATVPEPQTLALSLLGLGAVALACRRPQWKGPAAS